MSVKLNGDGNPYIILNNTLMALGGSYSLSASGISGLGTASSKDVPATGDATSLQVVLGSDSRLTDSRNPSGTASGDLTGTYPAPSLAATGVSASTYGSTTTSPQIAVDAKGRITSASNQTIQLASTARVTGLDTALSNKANAASPTLSGTVTLSAFTTAGVLKNLANGQVTSSLISNLDILTNAGIDPAKISGTALTQSTSFGSTGTVSGSWNNLSVNTSGVTPGTYPKVTVQADGRVTSGTSLQLTDIPSGIARTGSANNFTQTNNFTDINASGTVYSQSVSVNNTLTMSGASNLEFNTGSAISGTVYPDFLTLSIDTGYPSRVDVNSLNLASLAGADPFNPLQSQLDDIRAAWVPWVSGTTPGAIASTSTTYTTPLSGSSVNAAYKVIGKTVFYSGIITITTGKPNSGLNVNLPVAANTSRNFAIGTGLITNGGYNLTCAIISAGTAMTFYAINGNGGTNASYANNDAIAATVPLQWSSFSPITIKFNIVYEAA